MTEPEAAAAHYTTSRGLRDGELIAVYDLGGGTFDVTVLHAGTRRDGERVVTAGGRVLTIAAHGATLAVAARRAYAAAAVVQFDGMHYRRDIGWRGLG